MLKELPKRESSQQKAEEALRKLNAKLEQMNIENKEPQSKLEAYLQQHSGNPSPPLAKMSIRDYKQAIHELKCLDQEELNNLANHLDNNDSGVIHMDNVQRFSNNNSGK